MAVNIQINASSIDELVAAVRQIAPTVDGPGERPLSLALFSTDELESELKHRSMMGNPALAAPPPAAVLPPAASTEPAPAKKRGRPAKKAAPASPDEALDEDPQPVQAEDEDLNETLPGDLENGATDLSLDAVRKAMRECQKTHGSQVVRDRLAAFKVNQISELKDDKARAAAIKALLA